MEILVFRGYLVWFLGRGVFLGFLVLLGSLESLVFLGF